MAAPAGGNIEIQIFLARVRRYLPASSIEAIGGRLDMAVSESQMPLKLIFSGSNSAAGVILETLQFRIGIRSVRQYVGRIDVMRRREAPVARDDRQMVEPGAAGRGDRRRS